VTREGHTVGAIVAVNACGNSNVGSSKQFWAAPFEIRDEFGGHGFPTKVQADALVPRAKGQPGENTTIALVATDAILIKAQAKQLAVMAQDGFARALYPVHTTLDGDTVFAAGTGMKPLRDPVLSITEIGATAANVLARAIARGIYEARALRFAGSKPAWKDKFGQ
jgi:L-aminopeptidase/D-esterase-like protein